jgi:antirestriction protein ArdC
MAYGKKTEEKRDLYQEVTDRLITALEQGHAPWLKPWKDGKYLSAFEPHNALSGRPYSGINVINLLCNPFPTQGYLTFNQIKSLGGRRLPVEEAGHGTPVIFWNWIEVKDAKTGEKKKIPLIKYFTVHNVAQCTDIDPAKLAQPKPVIAGAHPMNRIAAAAGIDVRHGGNRAFFIPAGNWVQMPSADSFRSEDHYQATLGHECIHATGHESRLKRDLSGRFGSESYAAEELIAEIGSAFLCARTGVPLDGLQHPAYIANWLTVLRNDKRAIFTAARHAAKAANFLMPEEKEENLAEAA